ncbi:MAG: hypothetical protein IPG02_16385 [Ignavibacteria bacterium]|nr:hypothetical protein [Ignavibacteria bacterium]
MSALMLTTATSANNQIINNILYNNAYSQMVMTDYSSTSYTPSYNNIVKGNQFYCLSFTQTGMEHQMFKSPSFSDYGTSTAIITAIRTPNISRGDPWFMELMRQIFTDYQPGKINSMKISLQVQVLCV